MNIVEAEVIIIGGGISGLVAAEYLSTSKNVIVITKSDIQHSNSYLAQGGVAAVMDKDDKWQEHYMDTLQAGKFHNDPEMTEFLVKEGNKVIHSLTRWGVPFDRNEDGQFLLGKEGGHHRNRIVHAGGDQTGKKIMETLIERVSGRVRIETGQYAVDLLVLNGDCYGVYCKSDDGSVTLYKAPDTILAGGGYAGIYSATSNPFGSDGSAVCMAYRAGAELADLEFVQFHPTLLKSNKISGLITEAVRGEGGVLMNANGTPIMEGVHPLKDLAPRDIVSRKIFEEIFERGTSVFLNIKDISNFRKKFPGVTALCGKAGISIEAGYIPVTPGAHFTMGGIKTDVFGRTTVGGLFAIGECANTGVHGANRLASNSLLEGSVFAKQTAHYILSRKQERTLPFSFLSMHNSCTRDSLSNELLLEINVIQQLMDKYAGICREEEGLKTARNKLQLENFKPILLDQPVDSIKRLNMQTMAWLTVTSCLIRKESRGSHYRRDFSFATEEWEQKKIIRSVMGDESIIVKKTTAGVFN
ncbi:L-aspartate oxidase [Fictibacillus phosphorivorans]|uniref:L-aspartate oxidase n=1 Tax=Fictibacillus phosphorivorans TaxID=1221500 RepID=UPI00203EBE63|nr:L-aspartate oxidase [Fictibacillus phosphorivorans]MCM3716996.1 L-aspartate oxidase [Fictibacillus phosphorivorans]MCM3774455.1 L-aspartate oxidase [Fictibacillus phosphorivorans]